jgi:hypothetical protein
MPSEVPDFIFGLAECPAQGGRALSEPCWNSAHRLCRIDGCRCLCHEWAAPRKQTKGTPRPELPLDAAPPLKVG